MSQHNINQSGQSIPRLALSLKETAEAINISPISVRRLVRRGLLKPSRGLRSMRFSLDEIKRYLAVTS